MSKRFEPAFGGTPRVLAQPAGQSATWIDCAAANLPADGVAGYETGCIAQVFNGSTGTSCYVNEGTRTSAAFKAVGTSGIVSGSPLVLNGVTYTSLQLNSIEALRIDDAAISGVVAAANTAGANVFAVTQAGGVATTTGKNGGSLTLTSGNGSAEGDGSSGGGNGGSVAITAGTGANNAGNGGNGGAITLTAGTGGTSSGGSQGIAGFIQNASLEYHAQANPGTLNSTGTLTAALLTGGIVTSTTGAAVTATLDTGSAMDTALGTAMGTNTGFYWSVINTGGNTLTVTASSQHSIIGTATVVTLVSARFFTRRTATATYVTYRMGG